MDSKVVSALKKLGVIFSSLNVTVKVTKPLIAATPTSKPIFKATSWCIHS